MILPDRYFPYISDYGHVQPEVPGHHHHPRTSTELCSSSVPWRGEYQTCRLQWVSEGEWSGCEWETISGNICLVLILCIVTSCASPRTWIVSTLTTSASMSSQPPSCFTSSQPSMLSAFWADLWLESGNGLG